MSVWPSLLAGALIAPPLGRVAAGLLRHRPSGLRRGIALFWHLGSVALWTALALLAGVSSAAHPGGHESPMIPILVAGFVWVEGFSLPGLPSRRTASAHTGGAAPRASGGTGPASPAGLPPQTAEKRASSAGKESGLGAEGRASHQPDSAGGPEESEESEEEALPPRALALLRRIQSLDSVLVDQIMTPRSGILFADGSETAARVLARMRDAGHNRLLVVAGGSLDRVLGVVHARDLAPLAVEGREGRGIRLQLRRCLRVPASQPVARLLESFRRDRVHVGIVADPLGRTLGLVTLGDVCRYIAGRNHAGEAAGGEAGS